ncbi:MAG: cyclic nucleotide-binding domain-containing protein [Chloroflexi bacterium]|nr:cyclic nucleotide-binding domain-containing protein [Chloroflexota bacterium]
MMNTGFSPKGVLTIDIVNFSLMKNQEQLEAIQSLILMLQGAVPESENTSDRRVWSPGGDGGSLTFEDLFAALETAKTIARLINDFNASRMGKPPLELRIGLHCGTVTKREDFDKRVNVWGEGINISARVAGLAKPGQILATQEFCERTDLLAVGEPHVAYMGKWWVKHDKFLPIYNLHLDGTGIPPSEVDTWFEPFAHPLRQAIETYEAMMEEERKDARKTFRVAVLCKRLMDLSPGHARAKQVLESFSLIRHAKSSGALNLYDPFFSPMSPRAIRYFFENAVFQDFGEGATIVEEGQPADSMMMVVSGEVVPYIHGNTIPATAEDRSESQPERKEVAFREGAIVGEMGLFTEGQRRTATLKATKNATTLTLKYEYLRMMAADATSSTTFATDDYTRREIRDQIWGLHCKRTIQNQINTHPLLQKLPGAAQLTLTDYGEFLPAKHGQRIELSPKDAHAFWTLVVSGSVTAHTANDRILTCTPGDCLGPLRLIVKENPFSKIEAAPGAQIVRFPWSLIKELINDENPPEEFIHAAKALGEKDQAALG